VPTIQLLRDGASVGTTPQERTRVALSPVTDIVTDGDGLEPGAFPSNENVRRLEVLGRRYAAVVRIITLPLVAVIGVLAAPDKSTWMATLAVVGVVGGWSTVYASRVVGDSGHWLTIADTSVLSVMALSTAWIVPAEWLMTGRSWVVPFVSFAAVVYQYYASCVLGALCAVTLAAAMFIGTALALPVGSSTAGLVTAVWSIVLAALGRMLWTFVKRGADKADDILTDVETARRDRTVAEQLRAHEQALGDALHDTAATTLMLVGQGRAGDPEVLAAAARRDLQMLASIGSDRPARVDLDAMIRDVLVAVPLAVDYRAAGALSLPAVVADAIVGAITEALNNVVKHARVDEAHIVVVSDGVTVRVDVVDRGAGFDPDTIQPSCRGLRGSIKNRMLQVGGSALITTDLGQGTRITLVWRR
jgi:hypothetical protein